MDSISVEQVWSALTAMVEEPGAEGPRDTEPVYLRGMA